MTELSELLGTLLSSVAKARHMTDLQTATIAEQYRANPLLEGLSVPRVRLPELRVDLPVIIEGGAAGSPIQFQEPKVIAHEAVSAITEKLAAWGIELPAEVRKRLLSRLRADLRGVTTKPGGHLQTEAVSRQTVTTSRDMLQASPLAEHLDADRMRGILDTVRRRVDETAEMAPGHPPGIRVNVVSAEVKERVSPAVVARLSLAIKEEGLEWEITRTEDGAMRRRLGPE